MPELDDTREAQLLAALEAAHLGTPEAPPPQVTHALAAHTIAALRAIRARALSILAELRAEIVVLRTDTGAAIAGLRADTGAALDAIVLLRADTDAAIADVRADTAAEFVDVVRLTRVATAAELPLSASRTQVFRVAGDSALYIGNGPVLPLTKIVPDPISPV